MPNSVTSKLKEAIQKKVKVYIKYKDNPAAREVYPHAVFVSNATNVILDAYQVSGYTSSNSKFPQWKQFNMKDIVEVTLSDETFKKVKTFNAKSNRYKDSVILID